MKLMKLVGQLLSTLIVNEITYFIILQRNSKVESPLKCLPLITMNKVVSFPTTRYLIITTLQIMKLHQKLLSTTTNRAANFLINPWKAKHPLFMVPTTIWDASIPILTDMTMRMRLTFPTTITWAVSFLTHIRSITPNRPISNTTMQLQEVIVHRSQSTRRAVRFLTLTINRLNFDVSYGSCVHYYKE